MSQDKGINISGRVLLDPYDDAGLRTGYLDPINVMSFKIVNPAPQEDQLIDNRQGSEGQLIGVRYVPKPSTVEIKLSTFPPEILSAVFMGLAEALTQGSGTGTDLPITLIPGRWVRLPKSLIATSGFAVATDATTPVAIPETDYVIDYQQGLIKYTGTTLTAPTPCLVDMGWGTLAGTKISGAKKPVLEFACLVVGQNVGNKKQCRLEAPNLLLYSDGLEALTGKWADATLKGLMQVPDGWTTPYTYEEF